MHMIDWDQWGKLKNGNKKVDYKELWIDGTEWYRWTFELKDSLLKRRFKAVPTYVTLEIASNVVDYVDDAGVKREQKTLWLRHLSLHAEDMTQQEADYLADCAEDMIDSLYYQEAM